MANRVESLKILVTGGAGFIGSHLVDGLLREGHEVKVLDNLHSGNLQNLKRWEEDPAFQFLQGDVRNYANVEKAVKGADAVFHEAALTSVPASIKDPESTKEVNVVGTSNLLEGSSDEGVERFVFASSCAIYGEVEDLPVTEDSQPRPTSPYAKSKLAAEERCLEYYGGKGLKIVILRYFNVYGPRQGGGRYAGVISSFLERLEEDEPPIIYGDGEQTRDFVYVKDVVKANLLSLEREVSGLAFNIGSGGAVTINDLCEALLEVTGRTEVEPIYESSRPNDIRHSEADLTRATKKLGYASEISLREGLRRLIKARGRF